jgi:hypothetical protein
MSITPTRYFSFTYILADSLFVLGFLLLLFFKKRYQTLLFALFGGVLYFAVDYGYFYLISASRKIFIDGVVVGPGLTALVLLWMSLSYGITNFAYIWILLGKDKEWKLFIGILLAWWMGAPGLLSFSQANIETTRTTGAYHLPMLIILLVGYLGFILYSLIKKKPWFKTFLYWNLIGISIQFFWEGALLLGGIRPMSESSLLTLVIDSLLETNLGMPYIALIFKGVRQKRKEDLSIQKQLE